MEQGSVNATVGGARWNYDPALQFFARMVNGALIDCKCALGVSPDATHGALVALHLRGADPKRRPTDEALLAYDWIANSRTPYSSRQRRYLSFSECCRQLGVDWERSRTNLLAVMETAADFKAEDVPARLAALRAADPPDDVEPKFNAYRVVPAVDQQRLF